MQIQYEILCYAKRLKTCKHEEFRYAATIESIGIDSVSQIHALLRWECALHDLVQVISSEIIGSTDFLATAFRIEMLGINKQWGRVGVVIVAAATATNVVVVI